MQFLVCSRLSIKSFVPDRNHVVISVMDPGDSEGPAKFQENEHTLGVLRLAFHDLYGTKMEERIEESPGKYTYFDRAMANQIWEFVNKFNGQGIELIVCQCEAGISRSAGIAAALSKCLTGDDMHFFKHYIPNQLVYRSLVQEWEKRRR